MRIAVFTCDKYSHLIPTFHFCFKHFWPDCPFPVEVVGETTVPKGYFDLALTGQVMQWSSVALSYFAQEDDLVLMMLEDYLICEPVDTEEVTRCATIMMQTDAAFLRMIPCPGPTLSSEFEGIGTFDRTIPAPSYLISLQATIWRPSDVLQLFEPGKSPWHVELYGSERARPYPKRFLGKFDYGAIGYKECCKRGNMRPNVRDWVKELMTNA